MVGVEYIVGTAAVPQYGGMEEWRCLGGSERE